MKRVVFANKDFLIVYGLIVIMIALSFAFIRKGPRPPVKLQLKKPEDRSGQDSPAPENHGRREQKPAISGAQGPQGSTSAHGATAGFSGAASRRPPGWDSYRPRQRTTEDADTKTDWRIQPMEKSLNIMFNWNGHSWDAYEVLGLPAGSSREAAHAALQAALRRCDAETVPFLQAAYDAIARK